MSVFKCSFVNCPYYNKQIKSIGIEKNKSDILLVFQSPGQDEWSGNTISKIRKPIDSINPHSCANRMRNSFKRKNVYRSNYDIAEAVCCYPGNNGSGRDFKPKQAAVNNCVDNMIKVLSNSSYKKIICFGKIAFEVVNKAIAKISGWSGPAPVKRRHPSSSVSNRILDNSY